MAKVTDAVAALALPVVERAGCELWDVEYVKEAGTWFLRVYIDKEGGVSIDDCEAVSRPLSDLLDEADPIEGSYTFEVKLYRPGEGRKEFAGRLGPCSDGQVVLELEGGEAVFAKQEIALVRLHPVF